jgi:hypothetical protein
MASADSGDGTPPSRKPWIWLSVVLTVVAAGLLFWALTIKSDLDSTQQELDSAQEALAGSREELDKTKQELDAFRDPPLPARPPLSGRVLSRLAQCSSVR